MTDSLLVGGVETFSTVDYPEHLAAVVFLQGCPWRCPFCYNTALQPVGVKTNFLWEKFVEFLQSRRGILDAVVFSGGEPLVQNFLPQAMEQVKALGYKVGLHTGGYRPSQLEKVLPLVDWIGFDIKASLEPQQYDNVTKTSHLPEVLRSLEMILASGKDFECRTTCDPRLLTPADILEMAKTLSAKGVKNYFLQKYRPVESDTITTESDCDNFFADSVWEQKLRSMFTNFDIRR